MIFILLLHHVHDDDMHDIYRCCPQSNTSKALLRQTLIVCVHIQLELMNYTNRIIPVRTQTTHHHRHPYQSSCSPRQTSIYILILCFPTAVISFGSDSGGRSSTRQNDTLSPRPFSAHAETTTPSALTSKGCRESHNATDARHCGSLPRTARVSSR